MLKLGVRLVPQNEIIRSWLMKQVKVEFLLMKPNKI